MTAWQPSLFDQSVANDERTVVRFSPCLDDWQRAARERLAAQTPPERIHWVERPADQFGSAHPERGSAHPERLSLHAPPELRRPSPSPTSPDRTAKGAHGFRVPRRFMDLARQACLHASPHRWSLLYRMLWRLTHGESHLMALAADPDVLLLQSWARAVSRDIHKMKAFVRFRLVISDTGSSRYVAWFEPDHHTVEMTAPFFRRRFSNMAWSILSPDACAHYDGQGEVWFTPGVSRAAPLDDDAFEQAWRLYYRSIFNPARLKLAAMRSEMPVRYWKNLPEANDIALLVRDADSRVAQMQASQVDDSALKCGPRPLRPDESSLLSQDPIPTGSLDQLALAASQCRRCSLWKTATQTVWGKGRQNASLMLVGEQPGDREDLLGEPFVGPAGNLLRRALDDAGIDPDEIWLTNTVKHFKFKPTGRRRLHVRPAEPEIKACLPFLRGEIDLVNPVLVICLGNTAAQALLGSDVRVMRDRGRVMFHEGRAYSTTIHPSAVLRMSGGQAADKGFRDLVDDLKAAVQWLHADPARLRVAQAG